MSEQAIIDHQTLPFAEYLVGEFAIEPDAEEPNISHWEMPFYITALGGLRRLAGVGKTDPLPEGFNPDPIEGAALYRELAYDRKLHTMYGGLLQYIADYETGSTTTFLRDHQRDILSSIAGKAADIGMSRRVNAKSPTGTGKTAVIVGLCEGLKSREAKIDPVGIIVLVPSLAILQQTVEAFHNFTDIKPASYSSKGKAVGDVTVMTYQSFTGACARGDISQDKIDTVIRDEDDTFDKGKIGAQIEHFCVDKATGRRKLTIGVSATMSAEKEVSYQRTVVESIGEGLLAPVEIYQRRTNAVVRERDDRDWRDDYSESEVRHLMDDTERNKIIVDEILSGLASGRRVMARCVAGDNLRHTQIIHDMLQERGKVPIVHPYAGDTVYRTVRSVIIRGDMNTRHREMLTKIYNNPLDDRIDALLFVGTLARGFDSPVTKKIVNGGPTRSTDFEEQLFGRDLRVYRAMNGNIIHAQAVDLVDETDDRQVLFEDIINRDIEDGMLYRPGSIMGIGLADLRDPTSQPKSALMPIPVERLQQAVRRLIDANLTKLGSVELTQINPTDLRGTPAAQVIAAAELLVSASRVKESQIQSGTQIPLDMVAQTLQMDIGRVLQLSRKIRIGLGSNYNLANSVTNYYLSRQAVERLTRYIGTHAL